MLEIQGTAACGWSYASRGCKKTWRRPEHSQHVDTGKSKPYWVFHKKLAKLYGVTVDELMKEE